ncbi:DNA replication licensing factor MCM4 [Nymphaea colorata]|nr:DNA replication licensing factor MCM4 [Nymphaea colorata]
MASDSSPLPNRRRAGSSSPPDSIRRTPSASSPATGRPPSSTPRQRNRRGRRNSTASNSSAGYDTPSSISATPLTPSSVPPTGSNFGGGGFPLPNTPTDDEPPFSSEAGDTADTQPPTLVWGTTISVEEVNAAIRRFLSSHDGGKYAKYIEQVIELEGHSLNVDAQDIYTYDPDLYNKMVKYPLEVLAIFDIVVMDFVIKLNRMFDKHIQARIYNLRSATNMRDLNPSDIEKLVMVRGMVIRCSSIIPEIKEAHFRCLVCGHFSDPVVVVRGRINEPTRCSRQECLAMNSMTLVHNRCRFADKQIVRLQETPDAIPQGETPQTVSLLMHDKLVDAGKPGDRVEITGVYRAMSVRVGPAHRTVKSLYKTYIDCLHVKKTDKSRMQTVDDISLDNSDVAASSKEAEDAPLDYEEKVKELQELAKQPDIYDRLTRSLAPNIWELDDVKKGLLCQLFGGNAVKLSSGANFRGDINILLVGDPGTSKSQLLQYIHKLSPRGIYTSGRGSSAVGLTAYVSKDPETGETVLESGALVLSDKGICCIDEFDKMSDNARSMLHEVMEQQTVSIAKAGIIASLNARTSVLACANPSESRYNPRLSVIDNIHLPPTLLSRFDLIYLILDKADENTDRRLARHIISLFHTRPESKSQDVLDLPTLTAYISYAKKHIQPKISDEAAQAFVTGYVEMRKRGNFPGSSKKVITATPRQIESVIRLSEALARMRFSELVEVEDVEEAFRLLKVALQQSAMDPATGTIDMDLITTGVSASERLRKQNLVEAARNLITEKMQLGGPSMRITQLLEELRKQSTAEVHLNDLRGALSTLTTEGFVTVHGDNIKRL